MHYTSAMLNSAANTPLLKPAPWVLKGKGILLVSRFDADELQKNPLTALWLKKRCLGGRGYYLALNFEKSPVGPYSELLVLPGKFQASQGKRHAIAQSFCDSADAIFNYSENWGLDTAPSAIAFGQDEDRMRFSVQAPRSQDATQFKDSHQSSSEKIFSLESKAFGPRLPFASGSSLIRLISEQGKKRFYLGFSIKGSFRAAKIEDLNFDSEHLIVPAESAQVRAFHLEDFEIELPIPIRETTIEHFKFRLSQQTAGSTSCID